MEKEVQERILREYIKNNYQNYSRELLREEAKRKNYDLELFDRIFNEVVSEKFKNENSLEKKENLEQKKQVLREKKEISNEDIKKFFIPTELTFYICFFIFLIISLLNVANSFKIQTNFIEEENMNFGGSFFKIGWPFKFFIASMIEEKPIQFKVWALILNLFIYLIFGYVIDLSIKAIKLNIGKNNDLNEELSLQNKEKDNNRNINNENQTIQNTQNLNNFSKLK